jgi:hypothetical protein
MIGLREECILISKILQDVIVCYDDENRLTYVNDQSANFIVSYGYDWMGRRAVKFCFYDKALWPCAATGASGIKRAGGTARRR